MPSPVVGFFLFTEKLTLSQLGIQLYKSVQLKPSWVLGLGRSDGAGALLMASRSTPSPLDSRWPSMQPSALGPLRLTPRWPGAVPLIWKGSGSVLRPPETFGKLLSLWSLQAASLESCRLPGRRRENNEKGDAQGARKAAHRQEDGVSCVRGN